MNLWKKKNIWLAILLVFFASLPLVYSAPVTDLNLSLVNPPAELYKDLNFSLDWVGGDANVVYWKPDVDENVTVTGSVATTSFNFTAANGTDLNTLYGWYWITDSSGGKADVNSNMGQILTINDGAGGSSIIIVDENQTANESGEIISGSIVWNEGYLLAGSFENGSFGFKETFDFTSANSFQARQSNVGGAYTLFANGSSLGVGGTFNFGSTYEIELTHTGVVNTFDWSFLEDGVEIHSGSNLDLGTETLNYFVRGTVGGIGTGRYLAQFDDLDLSSGTNEPLSPPVYLQTSFNTPGTKTIQATVQNSDGNASTSLQINIASDSIEPTIFFNDFNFSGGFSTNPINFTGSYGIGCRDNLATTLDVNVVNNDVNIFARSIDSNTITYENETTAFSGQNRVVYNCSDGFNSASATLVRDAFNGRFRFVWDVNGGYLGDSFNYSSADVNEVKVFNLDKNESIDLFVSNDAEFYFAGDGNNSIDIRIGYGDVSLVTTSRSFDMDVLDTNNVNVCFNGLQPIFEQVLFGSVERDITLRNATNGCYHIAATTRFAFADSFSLNAYLIPLTYNLKILRQNADNVNILVDGGTEGTINLDSLVLKQQLSQNIVITGDAATVTKDCSVVPDCNTFIITYKNLASNNDQVKFTIFNGTTEQLSFTETTNPNGFSFIFDSTDLNFNADVLSLRLEKTRDNGDVVTETIYFTPEGSVGIIDPTIALIFSFLIFIGGISLVVARFLFGWFGLTIALIALALLSFSLGLWYIVFMQGVMIMMLIYIGISAVKQEGVF